MAASFVKKSNGNIYLRLTGGTNLVNFAAVSEAGNTYALTIYVNTGNIVISKPYSDNGIGVCRTSNANPSPGGLEDNTRFPGCYDSQYQTLPRQQCYTDENGNYLCEYYDPTYDQYQYLSYNPGAPWTPVYARDENYNIIYDTVLVGTSVINYGFAGNGLREYPVGGVNQNGTPYVPDGSTGGLLCLGGTPLNWGSNLYAYPGSGYVVNPVALGVKNSSSWYNASNIFIRKSAQPDLYYLNRYANPWAYHFYSANPDYEYLVENQYSLEHANYFSIFTANIPNTIPLYRLFQRSGYPNQGSGAISNIHLFTTNYQEWVNLGNTAGWEQEGIVGYVYPSNYTNTIPVYRSYASSRGDYLFSTSYAEATNSSGYTYQGIAFYAPVPDSGVWKECQTAYIKQSGVWKKFYQNYGNSSWVNMLEFYDDAIDFAVQVIALN